MDYKEAAPCLTAENGDGEKITLNSHAKDSDFQLNKQEKTHLFNRNEELPGTSSMADIIHDEVTKKAPPRWTNTFLDYSVALPPAPPALIRIDGTEVCYRNGITAISGADKAGKSTLVRIFIASAISGKSIMNVDSVRGIKVLHIDTEQPTDRVLRLVDNAFRLAEVDRTRLDNYVVCALRTYAPDVRLQIVEETIEDLRPDLVILDGITDLLPDINDLQQSAALISRVLTIIDSYHCGLVVLIHTNPSDSAGKLRGHLGSEIMRKCETSIAIVRSDEGVFTCKCKASRGRPFDAFSFMKDGTDNLVPVDVPLKAQSVPDKILQAMEPGRNYSHSELVRIGIDQGTTESNAKYAIRRNLQKGYLIKEGKVYHLRTVEQVSQLSLI